MKILYYTITINIESENRLQKKQDYNIDYVRTCVVPRKEVVHDVRIEALVEIEWFKGETTIDVIVGSTAGSTVRAWSALPHSKTE
jgi:hypothetical protein